MNATGRNDSAAHYHRVRMFPREWKASVRRTITLLPLATVGLNTSCSADDADDTPAAPSNLSVEDKEGIPLLKWTDNSSNEVHFMLDRKEAASDYPAEIFARPHANTTTYLDEMVDSGVTYTYRVSAMTASDAESPWSNEVTFTAP